MTVANSVIERVGAAGTVSIYNSSTVAIDVVVDASGYWSAGTVDPDTAGALHTLAPTRLYDSRTATDGAIAGGADRSITVAGVGGVPASGVSAVVLNATAAVPAGSGYLSVTQGVESGDARTSSVNFSAGASRADLVVVPLADDGTITVHNGSTLPLNAVLDVFGYLSDGVAFEDGAVLTGTAYRSNDDRVDGGPIASGAARAYPLVPGNDEGSIFRSAVVTVTAVAATQSGYFTGFNADGSASPTSSLNHEAYQNVAQTMIVPLDADGAITLRNFSRGTAELIVDVSGFVLKSDMGPNRAEAAHRVAAELARIHRAAKLRLTH